MSSKSYHELYDRLVSEVTALHQANRRRISRGLMGMIIVLFLYLILLFVTQGEKVIILLLWIITMFALSAYLIAVEYLNYELKKKLQVITQTEHDFFSETLEIVEAIDAVKAEMAEKIDNAIKAKTESETTASDNSAVDTDNESGKQTEDVCTGKNTDEDITEAANDALEKTPGEEVRV